MDAIGGKTLTSFRGPGFKGLEIRDWKLDHECSKVCWQFWRRSSVLPWKCRPFRAMIGRCRSGQDGEVIQGKFGGSVKGKFRDAVQGRF